MAEHVIYADNNLAIVLDACVSAFEQYQPSEYALKIIKQETGEVFSTKSMGQGEMKDLIGRMVSEVG